MKATFCLYKIYIQIHTHLHRLFILKCASWTMVIASDECNFVKEKHSTENYYTKTTVGFTAIFYHIWNKSQFLNYRDQLT